MSEASRVLDDGTVTLYHGDALAVLAQLPSGAVDAIITDPPYSSGGMMRGDRAGRGTVAKYVSSDSQGRDSRPGFSGDNRDQRGYGYWCALWLSEGLRVVKPGGVCVLFTDGRQLPATTDAIQAGGWVWRGIVPWRKPVSRPQLGRFSAACEYAVWGTNGPREIAGEALPGFLEASAPQDREHITQKPIEILRQLVRVVPVGGTVLDPFAGSGTTLVAAKATGRQSIGVEIHEHFARVAVQRLSQTVMEAQLFADDELAGVSA